MAAENRYSRQLLISQLGEAGQEKLARSCVTVVGCGGLGSPVLTYLTLAGVGHIRLVDCDTVSETNLNRQFLYREQDIDQSKSRQAALFLKERNSKIRLEPIEAVLTEENAEQILQGSDVVVDCVDRISVRRLVGHACQKLEISLIEGGIHGFYGYVLPVQPGKSACLECLETNRAKENLPVPALGAVAGLIGSIQA
ncbi:MAG: HesA/MoeB/ThiF family protein, partial [Clostridia bacterium]|nr:HesA/MoeB/ThiF family protein [Clostridia bacterium]